MHQAFGLQQGGLGQLMSPAVMAGAAKVLTQGHVGGIPTGDTKMMPGTFIIDTKGIVQYTFYPKHIAEHAPLEDILQLAERL